jgi:gamma-glutamyl hydrolase
MNRAMKLNKSGIYFPVFGICMGMQYMLIVQSRNDELTEGFDSLNNYELPFNLHSSSRIMRTVSPVEEKILRETLALHNHSRGLSPDKFKQYKALTNLYNITATDKDRSGKEFISSIEGKKYPFYGFQWHIEHNKHAMKYFGRFIRNEMSRHVSRKCANITRKMKRKHRKTIKNGMDVSAFYYKHTE